MSQVTGANANANKGLYKMSVGKGKSAVLDFIFALSTNPSHRWIPFQMVFELSHLWITERQANWLVSMVATRAKNDTFTLDRVITEDYIA